MNNFYRCNNSNDLLMLLIKKGRVKNNLINVLCKNQIVENRISGYLWNHSVPHYVDGDPYIEKNNILITLEEKPVDMIICYEDANFYDIYKCSKKYFINSNYNLDGKYWVLKEGKWSEILKQEYLKC